MIGKLFSEGRSIAVYPLRLLYSTGSAAEPLQAGFTVSSKNFKRAVDRNRIKRLMREAYRLNKNEFDKGETAATLFFIYTGKDIMDFESLRAKMQEIIKKLSSQVK